MSANNNKVLEDDIISLLINNSNSNSSGKITKKKTNKYKTTPYSINNDNSNNINGDNDNNNDTKDNSNNVVVKTSKNLGSILRYFGGKNPAIKILDKYIPQYVTSICSPFTGGSSMELHCAIDRNIHVYAYDILDVLINFWQCLKEDPKKLVEEIKKLRPLSKEAFYDLRNNMLNSNNNSDNDDNNGNDNEIAANDNTIVESKIIENNNNNNHNNQENNMDIDTINTNNIINLKFKKAAAYFAVNRSSFSGGGLSAGYSREAAEKRFTLSSIEKLLNVNLENIYFQCMDFEQSILQHPNEFLFLDPPYKLEKSGNNLYGRKGDLHKNFDHQRLYNILKTRNNWLLCYNDCIEIRQLYKDFKIEKVEWSYSMSKDKASKEIVIMPII